MDIEPQPALDSRCRTFARRASTFRGHRPHLPGQTRNRGQELRRIPANQISNARTYRDLQDVGRKPSASDARVAAGPPIGSETPRRGRGGSTTLNDH